MSKDITIAVLLKLDDKLSKPIADAINTSEKKLDSLAGAAASASSKITRNLLDIKSPGTSGTRSDPLASVISATATARAAEYDRLLGLLNERYENGKRNATQYAEALSVLDSKFGKTKSLSSSFALIGTAIGAGIVGLAGVAKSGIDAADSLNDMSARLGVSVQTLASFKLAAEQSGTTLEGVGEGIAKLNRSIGLAELGNKKMAGALTQLGITARDPQQAFFQLADAVQRIQDPTERSALLSRVLGQSYSELIPLLSQGGDALRDSAAQSDTFAQAMSRLAPDADKFNDNLALLKINAAGFAATILADVVPALNAFSERFGNMRQILAVGGGLFQNLRITGDVATDLRTTRQEIRGVTDDIARLKKNSNGTDSMILPLEKELARLTTVKAKLQEIEAAAALAKFREITKPAAGGASNIVVPPTKTTAPRAARAATDPLAGILSATDTARAAEYDRLLGLLDARYQKGIVSASQYGQAVDVLNSKFGKTQQDVFGNGSFSSADKGAVDFIRQQQDAINSLGSDMANDASTAARNYQAALSSLISDTDIAKTEQLQSSIDVLNQAFFTGEISTSQYEQALDKLTTKQAKVGNTMDEFTKNAAQSIQRSFSDFLFNPFDKGVKGMLAAFGDTIKRMIADAAAAQLVKSLFGESGGSGSSGIGGFIQTAASFLFSAKGNAFSGGHALAFASGGAFTNSVVSRPTAFNLGVMGEAGPEAIVPLSRMSNGQLGVQSAGGGGAGGNVQVNVINNASGTQATATERSDGNGNRTIDVMIEQVKNSIAGDIGRGNGAIPSALAGTYGLNRVAGAY